MSNFAQCETSKFLAIDYKSDESYIPTYKGKFFTIKPNKKFYSTSNLTTVKDINTKWDLNKFLSPRAPVYIAPIKDKDGFQISNKHRCIHLPIKLPQSGIMIPIEYKYLKPILQQMLDHGKTMNEDFDKYSAYLTFDQRLVPKLKSQRVPGPHIDGIPRVSLKKTLEIDHAYLATNAIPTMFYPQPFPMNNFELAKHNFFAIFRALL